MSTSTSALPTKKRKWIETGAPAQKSQSTRKGKKAWRKNVDISEIEAGLEGMREEEIVSGKPLQERSDRDLFQIDTRGDEGERKRVQKQKKPLRFLQVLEQRSAVPAVFARSQTSSTSSFKTKLSQEEKNRLLQKAKRNRKGAFNSYLDPKESGSAVVELRESGKYDVWTAEDSDDEALKKLITTEEANEYAPTSLLPSRSIERAAIEAPHSGISYNPSYESHQALLQTAHAVELKREAEAEDWRPTKERMEAMKAATSDDVEDGSRFKGMAVDLPGEDADDDDDDNEEEDVEVVVKAKPAPARKTKQQKAKAARLRAEKHALAQRAAKKRLAASLTTIKALAKESNRSVNSRESLLAAQKLAADQAKRQALTGKKIGKHVVKTGEVDVQLTDELSESLRGLQPEGNLFKDRFLSMQQRALVEPRERVLPRKKKIRFKEYEKHPYKRFT
ncbi:P60-like protein [Clavulina sp. PMI_390]|nr:P60-like protein [Clavulina sp. PMI_390]